MARVWKRSPTTPVLSGRTAVDPQSVNRSRCDRWRRADAAVLDIVFSLLSPTTFFLLVVNIVYVFFDTFASSHAVTGRRPGRLDHDMV